MCCLWVITSTAQIDLVGCEWTIYTFPNGNKASEGCLINGKPEGKWITYFEDGNIKSEGTRINYELTGLWQFYFPNGILEKAVEFENGKKSGKERIYNERGILREQLNFKLGKQEGVSEYFSERGTLEKTSYFENGLENGITKEWSESGRIITLLYFKKGYITSIEKINRYNEQGLKKGVWIVWNINHQKTEEGNWKKGMRHGIFKFYNAWGQLDRLEKFEFGIAIIDADEVELADVRKTYHTDGSIASIGTYQHNEKVGVFRYYNTKNELIQGERYENAIRIAEGITDEQGRKQGNWKWYYSDGSLRSTGSYVDDLQSGKWVFFDENGNTIQTGVFRSGMFHGEWVWYYSNGSLHRKENYRLGKEDGLFSEWNQYNEILLEGVYDLGFKQGEWIQDVNDHKEIGLYVDGLKQGKWRHFYNQTNLQFEGEFEFGEPVGKHSFYTRNGAVSRVEQYEAGVRHGRWVFYNNQNLVDQTREYRNGELTKVDGHKIKGNKN